MKLSRSKRISLGAVSAVTMSLVVGSFIACAPVDTPQTGSQTNWMKTCHESAQCGALDCVCGTCTQTCSDDESCSSLEGSRCLAGTDSRAQAICDTPGNVASICAPTCGDTVCPAGTICDGDVCVPSRSAATRVDVDLSTRFQTLVGFGSSLAYGEAEMVAHPQKAALFDAMFTQLGPDVLRLGNRYRGDNEADLAQTAEILSAAEERLGFAPTLLMTGTPAPELKASGVARCGPDPAGCTLRKLEGSDEFDYPALGDFWRASVEAYLTAGIELDYLNFQNDPNWLPPLDAGVEACVFLPEEGTKEVEVDGEVRTVEFAGYRQALASVASALADLPNAPRLMAPEATSLRALLDYADVVSEGPVAAIACHLYASDPSSTDLTHFEKVAELGETAGLPIFQTEMNTDGLNTAILIHRAMTSANAVVYLQNDYTSTAANLEPNESALIRLTEDSYELQGPYHAIRHYAYHTDPGFVRVDAVADSEDLLVSAWQSPNETALTLVLVNPQTAERSVYLAIESLVANFDNSLVVQTQFDAAEGSQELGELPKNLRFKLPARSATTIALSN